MAEQAMTSHRNKIAVVTGASNGIGQELAVQLAAMGYELILMGKNVKRLEATYDRIVVQGSAEPAILPLDMETAHWQQYADLGDSIQKEFGQVDLLIHAAARFNGLQPLMEADLNDWVKTMHVNLTSAFLLTRALGELLAVPEQSQVIFLNDAVAAEQKAYWGAYSISKTALNGLAGLLREELEHQCIDVRTLVPAPTATGLRTLAFPAETASNKLSSAADTAAKLIQEMSLAR